MFDSSEGTGKASLLQFVAEGFTQRRLWLRGLTDHYGFFLIGCHHWSEWSVAGLYLGLYISNKHSLFLLQFRCSQG